MLVGAGGRWERTRVVRVSRVSARIGGGGDVSRSGLGITSVIVVAGGACGGGGAAHRLAGGGRRETESARVEEAKYVAAQMSPVSFPSARRC